MSTGSNHFKEALKLVIRLHELQYEENSDNSPEADHIRDSLDIYYGWCSPLISKRLSEKELDILQSVSGALKGEHKGT